MDFFICESEKVSLRFSNFVKNILLDLLYVLKKGFFFAWKMKKSEGYYYF